MESKFQTGSVVSPGGSASSPASIATEHAASQSALESLLQDALKHAQPLEKTCLQEVQKLGSYPKRSKNLTTKKEKANDSLAQKLSKAKRTFSTASLKYFERMQARDLELKAGDLMQKVRALGHIPTEHKPEEDLLAHQLRNARAAGHMQDYEQELLDMADKDAETKGASIATEHAKKAEALMQQVRALGHIPTEHKPEEDLLAHQLRNARAAGHMQDYEQELLDMADKDAETKGTSIATEHAKKVEDLMQQVRALGHLPTEHKPEEDLLAQQLRKARAAGLMVAHEVEWKTVAAADEQRRAMIVATEHKQSLEAFYLIAQRAVRRAGLQRAKGPWEERMQACDAEETREKR